MGKKEYYHGDGDTKGNDRIEAVRQLLRKQSPLTVNQEKFCNDGCVERFLRAKGESVKKTAKHLRACLAWRDTLGTDHLIADEFSAELAEGVAYVAGHDHDSRPVLIFRMKQDYQKSHSQKMFSRLVAFTLEVAISTMSNSVQQFVLLFDASFFRSASAFMNLLLPALKIVADYYPGRLFKAFVIDPPSLFSYMWKGVRAFVELSTVTMMVSSVELDDVGDFSSLGRFDPIISNDGAKKKKIGSSSSSRFSFTVSQSLSHSDSALKPWYLTLTDLRPSSQLGGPARISPLNARSLSFASTPLPHRTTTFADVIKPRTPRPSFLHSPAMFFRKLESSGGRARGSFMPFLKFYTRPYDEMVYRSKMRPPLGGLISIVKRRHVSLSQRF